MLRKSVIALALPMPYISAGKTVHPFLVNKSMTSSKEMQKAFSVIFRAPLSELGTRKRNLKITLIMN